MSRDHRIGLTFDLPWLWKYAELKATIEERPGTEGQQAALKSIMLDLQDFDIEMQKYGDFCVFDIFNFDNGCSTEVYRLGIDSLESQASRHQSDSFQRIMYVRLHDMGVVRLLF